MEEIINNTVEFLFLKNGIVAIPVFSTMLVILFKAVSYRGEYDSDTIKSMLNIGLDLATAGIFVLLTNISFSLASSINDQPEKINDLVYRNIFLHGIKILLYLVIVLVFSLGIKIFAWDKGTASPKNTWGAIITKGIIGILLLALSILFAGSNV